MIEEHIEKIRLLLDRVLLKQRDKLTGLFGSQGKRRNAKLSTLLRMITILSDETHYENLPVLLFGKYCW